MILFHHRKGTVQIQLSCRTTLPPNDKKSTTNFTGASESILEQSPFWNRIATLIMLPILVTELSSEERPSITNFNSKVILGHKSGAPYRSRTCLSSFAESSLTAWLMTLKGFVKFTINNIFTVIDVEFEFWNELNERSLRLKLCHGHFLNRFKKNRLFSVVF